MTYKSIITRSMLGALLVLASSCPFAADVTGTLIQTIITKSPPWPSGITSPDPSGLAYLDHTGRLLDCDGEVDEMSNFFTGDNLFEVNLDGTLGPTHSTTNLSRSGFSNEPVGCAYNPANRNLFISDDDQRLVFQIRPGPDNLLFTADDIRTQFRAPDVCDISDIDAEGLAFGAGKLFIIDGVGEEVWQVTPSADGIFDGSGETCTHFDTSGWVTDPEGGEYDTDTGHLFVVGKPQARIVTFTTAGTQAGTIDIASADADKPAGLAAAPGSRGSNDPTPGCKNIYIVDRGVDNDSDSNENDGKIYELSIPCSTPGVNQAPTVNAGLDRPAVSFSAACVNVQETPCINLDGTVTDDALPNPPGAVTTTWSKVSGPGTVTFGNINAVDTTADFSVEGSYVLRLTANDSALSNSDDVQINILPPSAPLDFTKIYVSTVNSGTTANGIAFGDEDILAYDIDTGTWSMHFDGSDVGLGASGTEVDAFHIMPDNSILLSFSADGIAVPNVGAVDDSDIVRFIPTSLGDNTAGTFEWYFDGSDVELTTTGEDIDAIGFTPDGRLVISTTGNPAVTGVSGAADEDLLVFTPTSLGEATSGAWALYFDGSDVGLGESATENVNGVMIDSNGDIYLTTLGAFTVTGASGGGADIFKCGPISIGAITDCSYELVWNGISSGLPSNAIVNGIDLVLTTSGGDVTPPTVSLTTPANGATVSTTTTVSADASDNVGVLGVQFKLDGVNLGAEDMTVPYEIAWDTTTAANGDHSLTAVARDAAGNIGTTSGAVVVTVNNSTGGDAIPPTVSLTVPANGATVSNTAIVSADASDNVGVAGVQFKLDGVNLGAEDTTVPYEIAWDTTTAANGNHSLTAVARDAAGLTGTSDAVDVTVDNSTGGGDAIPPTVSLTSPANGATVSITTTVSADASDNIGVAGVQFKLDDVNLGAEDTTVPYEIAWDTTTAANGDHSLTAVARDAAGNTGTTSGAVVVTVNNSIGGGSSSLEIPVLSSTDDAEEIVSTGNMDLASSDLELTLDRDGDQTVGLRFNAITIPQGATITNAYVQFTVDEANSTAITMQIAGQAADNAPTFTSASGNISSRPKTGASAPWTPAAWPSVGAAGPDQRTPNIAAVIQEIVDRAGWASGNALAVIITGNGTGKRVAEAFNGVPAAAPLLHVDYSATPPAAPSVSISSPANNSHFAEGVTVNFSASATDPQEGNLTASLIWAVDGTATGDTGGSFSTSALTVGPHTVTASVTDIDGNPGSDSISVVIDPVPTVPTVTMTSPADGEHFTQGETVNFIASATDPQDGNLTAALQWSVDGTATGDTGGSFSTSALTVGPHTVTASVTDIDGNPGSDSISVVIDPVPTLPTVTMTSPADGEHFTQGETVNFIASATDPQDGNLTAALQWSVDGTATGDTGGSFSTSALTVGPHTVTASVTDNDGNPGSDSITVMIDPAGGTSALEVRVLASTDDAEEIVSTGVMDLASSDLELTLDRDGDQTVGLRFNAVTIPQGATITNAYVQFTVDETNSTAITMQIAGQAADNAPTFTSASGNISSRPTTGASVSWTPAAWPSVGAAGPDQRTPNIAAVIQEIIDRASWASGNSLAVIVTGNGTGKRVAEAFNGVPAAAPLLHVEYTN